MNQQSTSPDEHHDRYWQILQYNIDWLRFSETKATVILTVYGIILTIAYTNANSVFDAIAKSNFLLIMTLIYAMLTIASVIFSFLAINPTLKNLNPNSILYFGHISNSFQDAASYKIHTKSILDDNDRYTDQLADQIYINSKIAWKKYLRVTWSLRLFFCSLIIVLLSLSIYMVLELPK